MSACRSGKIRYRTDRYARAALLDVRIKHDLRGRTDRREAGTYRCRDCKGWHLTSQRKDATT